MFELENYIDVILPIPLENHFTYAITEAEAEFLRPGMRVAVPFGKRKIYTAIVFQIHKVAPEVYEAKSIHQILDNTAIITQQQFKLWSWIAKYYMCTVGEVMKAALPSAFLLESETIISLNTSQRIDDVSLKDDEFLVYEALQHQPILKVDEISAILNKKNVLPILNALLKKEAIQLDQEIYEKYKPKLVRYIKLTNAYTSDASLATWLAQHKRAPKQTKIVLTFFTMKVGDKPIKASELIKESGASMAQLKALIDKGVFEDDYQQIDRIAFDEISTERIINLNSYQEEAFIDVKRQFESIDTVLLHGITSSGKTELYIKLIQEVLLKNQQVLYLVPEIALTTQLVSRLKQFFGNQIAVYHSKYSLHERVEVWNNVLLGSDKARVILGARSSVMLPFHNLGLIIVDEEHEQSYKQFDPAPRYHARDTAVVLANIFKTKTLLGSATPSIESYYNATQLKKYGFVALSRRYNDVLLPEIELVDIKDKHKRKRMKGHFSDVLIQEMTEALEQNLQIILFQNRRGYSPIVECTTCGHSPQCPNCDVSLTHHQYKQQLRCHYCGYHMAMQQKCMACGSLDLDNKGFGTEQIQEEVKVLFPEAKIARMDLDTTRGKYGYERIITSFENKDVDILVGTQMLTKGLDFRHVKLVGVMNADNMLNFPDFRAHERSYQLMQQVAGRAGRTAERGKVLIQTYNPLHNILQQVSSNDYVAMFEEQMDERHNYKYPPIYRLIKITLKHRDYQKVDQGADWLATSLKQVFKQHVLGPEFPPIARLRNQYHKNILIKIPNQQSLGKTKEAILKVKNSFLSIKEFRSIRVVVNVDNY